MVLLAKRVSAKRPPEKRTSTSSAEEIFLMRSKMSPACSFVSIQHSAFSTQQSALSPRDVLHQLCAGATPTFALLQLRSYLSVRTRGRRLTSNRGPIENGTRV